MLACLLAESHNPSQLLEEFVQAAGQALDTVTGLSLDLDADVLEEEGSAEALDDALALLFYACPILTSLAHTGHLSTQLLHSIGSVCPQLTALSSSMAAGKHTDWSRLAALLPHLLPQVTSLSPPSYMFPDMSMAVGILALDISRCSIDCEADWLRLPPNLQTLRCDIIEGDGPPTFHEGRRFLSSLLHVTCEDPWFSLTVLAQILRAAPALKSITAADKTLFPEEGLAVYCYSYPNMAAELLLVRERVEGGLVMDATYSVSIEEGETEVAHASFIANLPRMQHVTRCHFKGLELGMLGSLIRVFPSIQYLKLLDPVEMSESELHALQACSNLTHLCLQRCDGISVAGLVAVCKCLPRVCSITCDECSLIKHSSQSECERLMARQGLFINIK